MPRHDDEKNHRAACMLIAPRTQAAVTDAEPEPEPEPEPVAPLPLPALNRRVSYLSQEAGATSSHDPPLDRAATCNHRHAPTGLTESSEDEEPLARRNTWPPSSVLRLDTSSDEVELGRGCWPTQTCNEPGHWDIMISYVQDNARSRALAWRLLRAFEKRKKTVWLDGEMENKSEEAMQEAAKRSRCVVAIISGPYDGDDKTAYFNREFCRKEICWANEARRFVQPVVDAEDRVKDMLQLVPKDLSHLKLKDVTWEPLTCSDKGHFELGVDNIIAAADGHARRQLAASYPPGPEGRAEGAGMRDPLLPPTADEPVAGEPVDGLTRNDSIKRIIGLQWICFFVLLLVMVACTVAVAEYRNGGGDDVALPGTSLLPETSLLPACGVDVKLQELQNTQHVGVQCSRADGTSWPADATSWPAETYCKITCDGYTADTDLLGVESGAHSAHHTPGETRTCAAGSWTGDLPTCVAERCTMIDEKLHSALSCSGSTGDTCTLQCDEGYAVNGSPTLTCGEDHVWRGSGTCEAVDECAKHNGGCSEVEVCTYHASTSSMDCLRCIPGYTRGEFNTGGPCEPRCVEPKVEGDAAAAAADASSRLRSPRSLKDVSTEAAREPTKSEHQCVFPFTKEGKMYADCTDEQLPDDLPAGSLWCATGSNAMLQYAKCVPCEAETEAEAEAGESDRSIL